MIKVYIYLSVTDVKLTQAVSVHCCIVAVLLGRIFTLIDLTFTRN